MPPRAPRRRRAQPQPHSRIPPRGDRQIMRAPETVLCGYCGTTGTVFEDTAVCAGCGAVLMRQ